MRYIRIEPIVEDGWNKGYSLDAEPYLIELSNIKSSLPEGARRFALYDGHYDLSSSKCVKDLKLAEVKLTDQSDRVSLAVGFAPNSFKHDEGLSIRYRNVVEFSISVVSEPRSQPVWPETRRLGDIQLDEILPHENGCSHEIQMTGGILWIVAEDLVFEWDTPTKVVGERSGCGASVDSEAIPEM